jgi:hypothetical protein
MKALAIAFFAALLFAPLGSRFLGVQPARVENRSLSDRPVLQVKETIAPGYFEKVWATYLRDQLPFRDYAAAYKARVSLFAFRESPNPRVLVGQNGFLFLDLEIDNACGNPASIADMVENATAWSDYFASRGGRFIFVLVPDKAMIYWDNLTPAQVKRYACTREKNEQLRVGLRSVNNLTFIDLYPDLARAAAVSATPIYHLRDTHWLGRFSVLLPEKIVSALAPRVWNPNDFEATEHIQQQDLAKIMGIRDEETDIRYSPRVKIEGISSVMDSLAAVPRKVTNSGDRPLVDQRVVAVSDSFFNKSHEVFEIYMSDVVYVRPSRVTEPSAAKVIRERPVFVVQAVMRNAHEIFGRQLTREHLGQVKAAGP